MCARSFVAMLAILALAGCSDNSSNPPTVLQIVIPKLGTRFFMDQWTTDSNGVEFAPSRRSVVDSVAGVNDSFGGRDSVVHVVANASDLWISYQADGDVAITWSTTNDTAEVPRWLVLPTETAVTTSLPAIVENDGTVMTTYKVNAKYIGNDSATINGKKVYASIVRVTETTDDTAGGTTITSVETYDLSFCADIGYFINIAEVFVDRGIKAGGLRRVMTRFQE